MTNLKRWLKQENEKLKEYQVAINFWLAIISTSLTVGIAVVSLYLAAQEFYKTPKIDAIPSFQPLSINEPPYVWIRNSGRSNIYLDFDYPFETICGGKHIQWSGSLSPDTNKNPLELRIDEWIPFKTRPGFTELDKNTFLNKQPCYIHATIKALQPENVSTELKILIK